MSQNAAPTGSSRLLAGVPSAEKVRAAETLAGCPAADVGAGEPYFHASFPDAALLVVEQGFVIVRQPSPGDSSSIVTCEAGAGRIILPPAGDEVLVGLADSRVTAISYEARDRLLALPGAAKAIFDQLVTTLGERQDALGNLASRRHIDRVRRKLLQLARNYGHVAGDGIRIDFPVSHTLLADMIASSRETVTRALDELQRRGFVVRSGHTYRLLVSPQCVLDGCLA